MMTLFFFARSITCPGDDQQYLIGYNAAKSDVSAKLETECADSLASQKRELEAEHELNLGRALFFGPNQPVVSSQPRPACVLPW